MRKYTRYNMTQCLFAFILSLLFNGIYSVRIVSEDNHHQYCDYSKCFQTSFDPNIINIHLVPHTHDDVGWLKTVDQYYYGSKNDIQNAGVQYIIDTVIDELIKNKDRRFIYVETAFFWKWWQEQDNKMRSLVKELVQTGQLEFINGGWSMPDEANTHYNSLIDQYSWGLRRLWEIFGECGIPRVTWQIDPFGHSRELASLYAQMGYDAMYFAREDYQDESNRIKLKTLEHVWQGSDDIGTNGDLFSGKMHMGYNSPKHFQWDLIGGIDEPVIDNPNSEEYNVPNIVKKFVQFARNYKFYYTTNHLMVPMGTDFNYQAAVTWFKNMDKLIKAVNAETQTHQVRVFYSTPSCYTKALWNLGQNWTSKKDDYFPYASDKHSYWTGYFTSRPALKRMERVGNNWLQACKQLDVLANNAGKYDQNITVLREAMGVMQHHDAVAGTEKQLVAYDYAKMLHKGIKQCQSVIAASLASLGNNFNDNTIFCNYLNISSCDITESGESVAIIIYNPLAHELINHTIRLPVNGKFHYWITDSSDKSIPSVLVDLTDSVRKLSQKKSYKKHRYEIVFRANIKALGLATYYLQSSYPNDNFANILQNKIVKEAFTLKGKSFLLKFDKKGQMSKIILKDEKQELNIKNDFAYYKSAVGNNLLNNRSSGAYIFRPQEQHTWPAGNLIQSQLVIDYDHYLVQEVRQKYDSFMEQIIRVDIERDEIEFDFVVGPIPVQDGIGKEIVIQYKTNLNNDGEFLTDANGRQMMRRKWNYRPTWHLNVEEPISGNYYPVNSRIAIQDYKKNLQLTILNDRSQGGTSPQNGTIELMVHRRILHDDAFGVDEPLNEPGVDGNGLVIRGNHYLLISSIDKAARKHRKLGQQLFMQPIIGFHKINTDKFSYFKNQLSFSNLQQSLPHNIHLLTLEQWHENYYLIRLEHFFQRNEDKAYSKPVVIYLRNLFKTFEIVQIQEVTLAANRLIEALKYRLKFNYDSMENEQVGGEIKFYKYSSNATNDDSDNFEVKLNPMEIRTFIIKVKYREN